MYIEVTYISIIRMMLLKPVRTAVTLTFLCVHESQKLCIAPQEARLTKTVMKHRVHNIKGNLRY